MSVAAANTMLGVGVVGLGVMGRMHLGAYIAAAAAGFPCRVVAICDPDPQRRAGLSDIAGNLGSAAGGPALDYSRLHAYADPDQLLRDPAVQLVSICTYTDTHVDLALRALAAGKHVLVEKPVALRSDEVRRLADAARASSTLCMPAMCMRFWPAWRWLKARVQDRSLGPVRSAAFTRVGSGPGWAAEFYRDPGRSGGAFIDLHIHDADFVHWCFGPPRAVTAAGDAHHVTTLYHYGPPAPGSGPAPAAEAAAAPLSISARGAWDLAPPAGFRMQFLVTFEHATAEFDFSHPTPLRLHRADASESVALEPITGYDGEVRHLVATIAAGARRLDATLDEAVDVMRLLEAEERSMRAGRTVELTP